jgi:hypothetical protein
MGRTLAWTLAAVMFSMLGGAHADGSQASAAAGAELAELYAAAAPYSASSAAAAVGYRRFGACFEGSRGGHGIRVLHADLAAGSTLRVSEPQALLYERRAGGQLRLLGVEYHVATRAWHEAGHPDPPVLFGRSFVAEEPVLGERIYRLRVWIGAANPHGLFADAHPLAECQRTGAIGERATNHVR